MLADINNADLPAREHLSFIWTQRYDNTVENSN